MTEYWHQTIAKLEEERDQAYLLAWDMLHAHQHTIKNLTNEAYQSGYDDGYHDGADFRKHK